MDVASQAVGATLRAERARAKLTHAQLAQRTRLGLNTIKRFEYGERSPNLAQLFVICAALDVSPSDFLDAAQKETRKQLAREKPETVSNTDQFGS